MLENYKFTYTVYKLILYIFIFSYYFSVSN